MQKLTPGLAQRLKSPDSNGVVVTNLAQGGPAVLADFKRGDIVRRYNDTLITSPHQLHSLIAQTKPGTSVTISRLRHSQLGEVKITVAERKPEKPHVSMTTIRNHGKPMDRVLIESLPSDMKGKVKGILVSEITRGSLADTSGLEEGDIIMEINQKPIESVKAFEQVVSQLNNDKSVLLLILREGTHMFLIIGPGA